MLKKYKIKALKIKKLEYNKNEKNNKINFIGGLCNIEIIKKRDSDKKKEKRSLKYFKHTRRIMPSGNIHSHT